MLLTRSVSGALISFKYSGVIDRNLFLGHGSGFYLVARKVLIFDWGLFSLKARAITIAFQKKHLKLTIDKWNTWLYYDALDLLRSKHCKNKRFFWAENCVSIILFCFSMASASKTVCFSRNFTTISVEKCFHVLHHWLRIIPAFWLVCNSIRKTAKLFAICSYLVDCLTCFL